MVFSAHVGILVDHRLGFPIFISFLFFSFFFFFFFLTYSDLSHLPYGETPGPWKIWWGVSLVFMLMPCSTDRQELTTGDLEKANLEGQPTPGIVSTRVL